MALQLSRQHPPRPVWALSAIEPLRAELGLPAGSYVIGTAMHVAEGFAWRDIGADAIAAHFGDPRDHWPACTRHTQSVNAAVERANRTRRALPGTERADAGTPPCGESVLATHSLFGELTV
jgi:hypothetical protein